MRGDAFVVRRLEMPAGVFESDGRFEHGVTLHVGAPVRATCTREGKTRRALYTPGDFEFIPSGQHGRWVDEGAAEIITFKIRPDFLRRIAEDMGAKSSTLVFPSLSGLRDEQLLRIAMAVDANLRAPEDERDLVVEALGLAFCARIVTLCLGAELEARAEGLSLCRQRAVEECIAGNLGEKLLLADLARAANLSPTTLKAQFRQTYGVPVHQHLMQRRLDEAVRLIRETDLSLEDVSLEAGFAHQSHMTRIMRKKLGITPGELRNQ